MEPATQSPPVRTRAATRSTSVVETPTPSSARPHDLPSLQAAIDRINLTHLAESIGYARPHVSRVLRGLTGPSPECAQAIADGLQVPIDLLETYIASQSGRRVPLRPPQRCTDDPLPPLRSDTGQVNPIAARWIREMLGLTQSYVAEQLHVSRSAVYNWETGRAQPEGYLADRYVELLAVALQKQTTEQGVDDQ